VDSGKRFAQNENLDVGNDFSQQIKCEYLYSKHVYNVYTFYK
jgi:hypothetical protein